jgi:hypothetical protein
MRVVVVRTRLLTHEFDPGGEEIAQRPARRRIFINGCS